ncbi:DUF547 domain-containing protein [Hymenobacter sp.]|uniref:DUF547 domain-containing protein n=1 Tax=Hymenobacter sp. TaxID=1898978 RepID=UPI002ED99FA0
MKHTYISQPIWVRAALILVLLFGCLTVKAAPPTSAEVSASTTAFLKRFVNKEGEVNYKAIKRDPKQLDALLEEIASFDMKGASQADLYAFYLNAYNMLVIGEIIGNYPLTSVREMPGFFDKRTMLVGGEKMTLDELEHNKLRKLYDDPRLHFALVCGTASCPRLSREAYMGKALFTQLNDQTRRVLQDPAFVKVDAEGKTVMLSEIFKWYEADFGTSGKTGVAYVNQFRADKRVPTWFTMDYYAYDWRLNDQKAEEAKK